MTTQVTMAEGGRYVEVVQVGKLSKREIKGAREDSLPFFDCRDRALVDYRQADLSGLSLLDLDILAADFKHDVPKCQRMAIIRRIEKDESLYCHLRNVCVINGVITQLFTDVSAARLWLLKD